jgi:hypothetical protein
MGAALNALGALDPDFDADIDVPGAPTEDTDGDMSTDAEAGAPADPDAATADDDEEDYQPGSGCPCGCGCAVPDGMVGGAGCPCACGCEICAAAAPESAADAAPTDGAEAATETALVGESAPELVLPSDAAQHPTPETPGDAGPSPTPDQAPETSTLKESAVSETETPAAEAATTPAASAPIIGLTQEQFAQLLASVRPAVAETAPAAPAAPAVEQQPEPAAVQAPAPVDAAPASESVSKTDLTETVNAAVTESLKAILPALRDSIVSQYGLPPRTGIRTSETDSSGAEMTPAQMWEQRADLLLGNIGR